MEAKQTFWPVCAWSSLVSVVVSACLCARAIINFHFQLLNPFQRWTMVKYAVHGAGPKRYQHIQPNDSRHEIKWGRMQSKNATNEAPNEGNTFRLSHSVIWATIKTNKNALHITCHILMPLRKTTLTHECVHYLRVSESLVCFSYCWRFLSFLFCIVKTNSLNLFAIYISMNKRPARDQCNQNIEQKKRVDRAKWPFLIAKWSIQIWFIKLQRKCTKQR